MHGAGVIREGVRSWLIRWQMALCSRGLPTCRLARRRWLRCAEAGGHIVELLLECERYQTPGMFADIERFLGWLAKGRPGQGIEELRAAHALIAGATLVRRSSMLDVGRRRLHTMLATQHDEGWFPDARGVIDYRRQAAFSFGLARIACLGRWPEVDAALARLVPFVASVARPVPTGSKPSAVAFDSTAAAVLAAEVMADRLPVACEMTRAIESLCASSRPWEHALYGDDYVADLCAALSHAAGLAQHPRSPTAESSAATTAMSRGAKDRAATTAEPVISPVATIGSPRIIHHRGCGVTVYDAPDYRAVVDVRRGGSMRLWWRTRCGARAMHRDGPTVLPLRGSAAIPVIDDGACVAPAGDDGSSLIERPGTLLRPARHRSRMRFSHHACGFDGYVSGLRAAHGLAAWRAALRRWFGRRFGIGIATQDGDLSGGRRSRRSPKAGVGAGWHCRRIIVFGPHSVRIRDRITATRRARFAICMPNGIVSRYEPLPLLRRTQRWYAGEGRLIADRTYSVTQR